MFIIVFSVVFLCLFIFDLYNRRLVRKINKEIKEEKKSEEEIKTYRDLLLFPVYKYKDSEDSSIKELCRNVWIERIWFTLCFVLFIIAFFID